jgi:hypothetical protein
MLILVQKEKEDLEEISGELELVDEEEKVPYVVPHPLFLSTYCLALLIHIIASSSAVTDDTRTLDIRLAIASSRYRSHKFWSCWKRLQVISTAKSMC